MTPTLTFAGDQAHTQAMPRALAILKYIPAVLCGLLVVAHCNSLFDGVIGMRCRFNGFAAMFVERGSIVGLFHSLDARQPGFIVRMPNFRTFTRSPLGSVSYFESEFDGGSVIIAEVAVPLMLTVLMPFAIAPFARFRFPLWSYFAWTAIIAAELAYYLR